MGTDICAAAVIILTAVRYGKKGFAASVIRALSWIATIILGFMFSGTLAGYISKKTAVDDHISSFLIDNFSNELKNSSLAKDAGGRSGAAADALASSAASGLTDIFMTIIAFILIVIAVSVAAYLISTFFDAGRQNGVISRIDTAGGAAAGVIIGCIYVLIILGLLYACRDILPDGFSSWLNKSFAESYFCGSMYSDNPLVTLFKAVF
ncbi:MAG: hypothetical protein ACI4LM_00435 [Anaerovoracaceae bacterium]